MPFCCKEVSKMPYFCIGGLENAILLYRGSGKLAKFHPTPSPFLNGIALMTEGTVRNCLLYVFSAGLETSFWHTYAFGFSEYNKN